MTQWCLEVLAADPVPRNRAWTRIMKTKRRPHLFEEREEAESARAAMLRGNLTLEIRVVPFQERPRD